MAESKYDVVITRPCTDVPGRFIAESRFGRKFNMGRLCVQIKIFEDAKCSESLGIARFDHKNNSVILYRSGRIDLRKVKDVEEARATMAELETLLSKAFEP